VLESLLIANRGEIARRIIRSARWLGVRTIAVHSDADAAMPFVREADQAIAIGPAPARESYLNGAKILAAAKTSGAAAIHPGYGFLSENAAFAQDVMDAGLVWVGAPPSAISAMGLKDAAKKLMQDAGVPVTPGYLGEDQAPDRLQREADAIGYPVLIKAVAGGGGKGMRRVDAAAEFSDALASCKREALSSFGDDRVLLEKYITSPRHIEVQVFADSHGNCVHLFERDCSLQRRHQKLVEEAPAPFLSEAQVAELYRASKAIMREAGYVGAGTCEFLVGQDGLISFLEVNTRLQVEHPVTEEVAGIDLVREQFRIADGEALGYDDPWLRGHAFEFRINGEDPGRNFLPAPGRLDVWQPPTGPGVRLDAGFTTGDVIGGNFDSLLAKLIVVGRDRQEALDRARRALDEFHVEGIATALTFHRAVVRDPAFAPTDPGEAFKIHTRWIETEFDNQIPAYQSAATGTTEAAEESARTTVTVEVGGRRLDVVLPAGLGTHVASPAKAVPRRAARKATGGAGGNAVTAPMQGTIVKIAVAEGQQVAQGDLLVVLEAMKMEQPLTAHKAGTVTNLVAQVGSTVPTGTVLLELTD
jgi:acetyl-CoA/propionyl-CoA carboxylase biotin carboxyl carrier protein